MACFKEYVFLSLQVQSYNKTAISVAALHLGRKEPFSAHSRDTQNRSPFPPNIQLREVVAPKLTLTYAWVAFFGCVPLPLGSFYNKAVNMKRKGLAQYHRQWFLSRCTIMKRGEKYQVTDVRLLQGREAKRCEDPSGFGFSFAVSIKCLSLLGPTSALFSDLTSFQQFLCPRCPRLISLHAFVLLISFASPQNLCIEYSFLSFRFNLDITSSQIPSLIFQRQVMSTFPRNPP